MSGVAILMYHIVDDPHTDAERRFGVSPTIFRAQMASLISSKRPLLGLPALVDALRAKNQVPDNAIAVTFDDGFECFRRNALPVLVEFGIPATLFAIAGLLGTSNVWERGYGARQRRLLDAAELREAADAGITIGCHSMTHRRLTTLNDGELVKETVDARQMLTDKLGRDVTLFAYPHGDQAERERNAVAQAGFIAACSTQSGFNTDSTNLYALRRIDVYGTDSKSDFRRKVVFGANRVTHGEVARYYLSRLKARVHG